MYLGELSYPQKLRMGRIGDEQLFADCAQCEEKGAIIAGGYVGEDRQWCVEKRERGYVIAVYCEGCFKALLAAAEGQEVEDEGSYQQEIALR